MSQAMDPWQCGYCRKTLKATANHCSHCGASWEEANPNFVPPNRAKSKKKYQQSNWDSNWGYAEDYGKSPRGQTSDAAWHQRPQSPRQGRYRFGKHGKKGQHSQTNQSGKGMQEPAMTAPEGYAVVPKVNQSLPPEPPWRPTLPSMPTLPPLPPPPMPHPDSQAAQTLSKLTAVIKKKPDQYDPEVHAILQSASLVEGLNAKDQMLRAAEDLGQAREALDAARLGQYQNHVRWKDFLTSAATRWQEYTADFQKQEKSFQEVIEQAKATMANARERFEASKNALSEDDQHAFCGTMETDDPMAEKVAELASGKALQENLELMASNLISLRSSAEASVAAEEQAAKRQRLAEGDSFGASTAMPSSTPKKLGANALEPFAQRSDKTSFQEPGK